MESTVGREEHSEEVRTACPVCSVSIAEAVAESPNYYLCPSCKVVYQKTITRAFHMQNWDELYYSDKRVLNYYLQRYSGFRKMVQIMNRLVTERHKWLDIGCGIGALLEVAYGQSWEVYGIDPSCLCVEVARQRMPYAHIVHGTIEEKLQEFSGFTVVSLTDVLRHIEHPGALLANLRNVLADGGWIFIREMNASFRRRRVTSSPQEWSPRSLENAVRLAGFKNVHSIPSPAFVETTTYEHRVSAGLKHRVKNILKLGVWPVSLTIHRISCGRVFLGPNLITLGQK